MNVLVDTSVWSLALRRHRRDLSREERTLVFRCRDLVISGTSATIGPIVQETLSGIADRAEFKAVKERIQLIPELPIDTGTFVLAAEFYNRCRSHGISPRRST